MFSSVSFLVLSPSEMGLTFSCHTGFPVNVLYRSQYTFYRSQYTGIFFHVQCIVLTLQYKQSFFSKSQRKIWQSYSNTVASNTFIPAEQTKLTN